MSCVVENDRGDAVRTRSSVNSNMKMRLQINSVRGGKGAVDLLKQEENYYFRTSALEEDEVTGEPLWIWEGMERGLKRIRSTAD